MPLSGTPTKKVTRRSLNMSNIWAFETGTSLHDEVTLTSLSQLSTKASLLFQLTRELKQTIKQRNSNKHRLTHPFPTAQRKPTTPGQIWPPLMGSKLRGSGPMKKTQSIPFRFLGMGSVPAPPNHSDSWTQTLDTGKALGCRCCLAPNPNPETKSKLGFVFGGS